MNGPELEELIAEIGLEAVAGELKCLRASRDSAIDDARRFDWLVTHTEFRFRVYDPATKQFMAEQSAQGCVLRSVVDAAKNKWTPTA